MKLTLIALMLILSACTTTKRYTMPPALSEVYRNGAIKPLEEADAPVLGLPNAHDRVSHTCTSTPIWTLDGHYVRTDVRCW